MTVKTSLEAPGQLSDLVARCAEVTDPLSAEMKMAKKNCSRMLQRLSANPTSVLPSRVHGVPLVIFFSRQKPTEFFSYSSVFTRDS